MVYDHVFETGLFSSACEKWRNKELTEKTWEKFEDFFTKKVTDYLQNTTSNEAQFFAA